MPEPLRAPFPYFGGKSTVADAVWQRFGRVAHYLEPFCGSASVLLARPDWTPGMTETINDACGFIVNAYRAIQLAPEETVRWANRPVFECDLHAVHSWLLGQRSELVERLEGDLDYFDLKIGGRWLWGISSWIGSSWCSSNGHWHVVDGRLIKINAAGGLCRRLPHAADRQGALYAWFDALSARLRNVRICCGSWDRIMGPSVLYGCGAPVGIFLDPPYSADADRDPDLYTVDCGQVAHDARRWAIEHGDDPQLRIAYCDYGEANHEFPPRWEHFRWKANGGYGNQSNGRGRANARRETVHFSPFCIRPELDLIHILEAADA